MITHQEAEVLISARQDEPLDPIVERELQAHLATCDDCRAFAIATERLTAAIKALPSIPANPRTRRAVMERVEAGRNPLSGLFAGMGEGFNKGPVLAATAMLVIVGLFGVLALDRFVFDDGDNVPNNQIAAVPTEAPVDQFVASPTDVPVTETPEPTETAVPSETPEPTATTEPEPTSTTEPEPTDEPVPEPTATSEPEPTATTEPEPTATQTGEADEPVDLTRSSDESVEALAVETEEPTAIPTREPTVTPQPTAVPTDVPTEEPTVEPEPTETPAIEPIEPMGGDDISDGTGAAQPTEELLGRGSGPEDDDADPPIAPTGDSEAASEEATSERASENSLIEPIDAANGETESQGEDETVSTPEGETAIDADQADVPDGQALMDVSVRYSGIVGDPSGDLGLTRDGRLEFMQVPDGASMTTSEGFRLQSPESQPGVVQVCGDGFCEPSMEAPESDGWQGDVPLGVVGESSYFLRLYGDRTEVYSASSSGTQLVDASVIGEFGPTSAPGNVYENDGIMFTWLPQGEWLEISGGSAQIFPGGYANPTNVRFAPIADQGPLLGYFSDSTLVIAPVTAPDSAILTLPSDGVDFDIAPRGDRVAVIQGSDIVIYDISGNVLSVYEGAGDVQPGSLIWLRGGIVYVDRISGALYEMPETAP